jgi:hypothetical protein
LGRERRTRERRACSLYLRFINQQTGKVVGTLADISAAGFRLESTGPLPLHTSFVFRVEVPNDISGRAYITLAARSRWTSRDPLDPRLYNTGFEIMGLDAANLGALERMMQRYGAAPIGIDLKISQMWGR